LFYLGSLFPRNSVLFSLDTKGSLLWRKLILFCWGSLLRDLKQREDVKVPRNKESEVIANRMLMLKWEGGETRNGVNLFLLPLTQI
jgi:hypothetical protein